MAVKIGVAGPMTGAYAVFGDQLLLGAQAAADRVNATGGINGEEVILVRGDDAMEPKQAVAVANRLVDQDKVIAVVGHMGSSCTIPASEVYDEAGVFSITPGSTHPAVTERGLSAQFRLCGRDDEQGIVAANHIIDGFKAQRVAILHDEDSYGQGLADAVKAQLEKRGVKPVFYEGITRGDKDYSAVIQKLKRTAADVAFFGGMHAEAGPLIRQMREKAVKHPILAGDGIATYEFVVTAAGRQYANGLYMTFGMEPRKVPDARAVVEAFRNDTKDPEAYTLYAYAALQTLVAAFNGAKSNRGEDAAKWLKANPVRTVLGDKKWDSKGDLIDHDFVVYQWDSNEGYRQIEV